MAFAATCCILLATSETALAQYQMSPPEFGETYSIPTPEHPEPIADYMRLLDVGLLAIALGIATWLIYKRRSRKGLVLLSIFSVAYFGFYRKGCLCAVGAIQNVALSLVNPEYVISFSVIAIFFLPLILALFFGRVFCSGVCPLGALQDLVVLRPLRVPLKLDKWLRYSQFIYLAIAVILVERRFLICDWDPIVPIFRRSGPFYMIAIGAAIVVAGIFIGRPYCRWLCPYGAILSLLSRVSWKNLSITPDKELNCGMCNDACPYGSIQDMRADRGTCMTCARCYDFCPRQKRLVALRKGKRKPAPIAAKPRLWEALARTWTGIAALLVVIVSASWLLTTYIHAQRVIPGDKERIESLQEKARNDADIQKILQPELERQHNAGVARRSVYNRGGAILLISSAIFIAWFSLFRPKRGTGAGVPAGILKFLEKPPPQRPKIPKKPKTDSKVAIIQ